MAQNFSHTSSRTNIARIEFEGLSIRVEYISDSVSRGCNRYSATLVDCRHGYERHVPANFPDTRESVGPRAKSRTQILTVLYVTRAIRDSGEAAIVSLSINPVCILISRETT